MITNAVVVTMDEQHPTDQAVAVTTDGHILRIGTNAQVLALAGNKTQRIDAKGATVLPGFIDPHSHMAGYAMYSDTTHWTDVSSVNVYFKPAPDSSACAQPDDYQHCFIPVQNHADVLQRLRQAVTKARQNGLPAVLAFNYDPSRLGHGTGCADPLGLGLACPNFEDGHALEQLDALASDLPIYVTSESGHISYVNTPALTQLNICGIGSAPRADCHTPTTNPAVELALAKRGQLDEDLALYATGIFQEQVFKSSNDSGLAQRLLTDGAWIYANHGYTLAQEGAAGFGSIDLYNKVLGSAPCPGAQCPFPLSARMVAYDDASANFDGIIADGLAGKRLIGDNRLLGMSWLKSFTDGSAQGYTAYLKANYLSWFYPFTDTAIFPAQPYAGLPDLSQPQIEQRLRAAHAAGFPMLIHQIGDAAIESAVNALINTRDPRLGTPSLAPAGKHDVVLHAPMISDAQLDRLQAADPSVVVSLMSSNVYYYGLPECQQVLGPQRSINIYPARSVLNHGFRLTLHSDTPVTPPYPLFEIWTAVTRKTQQPSWYPNRSLANCPLVFANHPAVPGDQRISILEGIQAFTVNAAWQYGLTDRGSLKPGYVADMVLLSDNPLAPRFGTDPDQLRSIRTLATISYGRYFPNAQAAAAPIWPE